MGNNGAAAPRRCCCIVLNPNSAGGRAEAMWGRVGPPLTGRLAEAGFESRVLRTKCPGDGARLAKEAASEHRAAVVLVAGGDGLLNEVVTGLMQVRAAAGSPAGGPLPPALAVLPLGSGNDFAKTHGWSGDPVKAANRVASGKTAPLDIGTLTVFGKGAAASGEMIGGEGSAEGAESSSGKGEEGRRFYFANLASCGVGAVAAALVDRYKRFWPLSYQIAGVHALLVWATVTHPPWEVSSDGVHWLTTGNRPTLLAAGNGGFWGGGFNVCPGAATGDGALTCALGEGFGLLDFLMKGHMLRSGRHLTLPNVYSREARHSVCVRPANTTTATAGGANNSAGSGSIGSGDGSSSSGSGSKAWESLLWEVDGEPAGHGAGTVGIIPAALLLCV